MNETLSNFPKYSLVETTRKNGERGTYLLAAGKAYRMDASRVPVADTSPGGRQMSLITSGQCGKTMKAWAKACADVGEEFSYAWTGIVNSMGDHARVSPGWKHLPNEHIPVLFSEKRNPVLIKDYT